MQEINLPPTPPDLDTEVHGMATPPIPPALAAHWFQEALSPTSPEQGNPESASLFRIRHQRYQFRARPAHHPESLSMRELCGFIDRTLPMEDQLVPNPIPLSPDIHLRTPPEPPSPSSSRSPPPSR
jgi:hypothetical protein